MKSDYENLGVDTRHPEDTRSIYSATGGGRTRPAARGGRASRWDGTGRGGPCKVAGRHALGMRKAPRQRGLSWVLQRTTESILAPAPTGAMERPAMEDLGGA